MKRFIGSLLARNISRVLIVTMTMLSIQAVTIKRVHAQEALPSWAVVEFVNKSAYGGTATAAVATDAVSRELIKSGRYSIEAKSLVDQQMKELGYLPPLHRLEYMKLGQELNVDAIVSGDIEEILISKDPPRAKVFLSVYVFDSASGRAITGARGVEGVSTGRVGFTGGEDALVQEALQYAALEAVTRIASLQIPDATVLFADAEKVFLNKGTRSGLKSGMEMLILRYGDYVATIKLLDVSGDDARGKIVDTTKGVQPGDKARAVFPTGDVVIKHGQAKTGRPIGKNIDKLLVTILVVGLVFALIGKGVGGDNTATDSIVSEALNDAANGPGIKVSWHANLFAITNPGRVEWHIFRNDSPDVPVGVVPGNVNYFIDDQFAATFNWRSGLGPVTSECVEDPDTEEGTEVPVAPGTTYTYRVSLVYKIQSIDLPGGGGEDEIVDCFFESDTVPSDGPATALDPAVLEQPTNGSESVDLEDVRFSWDAVNGANGYVVELSTDIMFRSNVKQVAAVETAQLGGIVSTEILDLRGLFPDATKLYWRVGAKNLGDFPGPVPDAIGLRYVFSAPFEFTPVEEPPPPPGS